MYGLRTAPAAQPNLALHRVATSSAPCSATEGPDKAVNGSVAGGTSDKWCSLDATKFLQVDLGSAVSVSRLVVQHAAAGGEASEYNTRDFSLQISSDGTNFASVANVTGNTASTTVHNFVATSARYVRLNVTTPTQTTDAAARIYDLEVYGQSRT